MKILFLFLYSVLKAFLPLPSLEAVLIPMCLLMPQHRFTYAMFSGIGTIIGGAIGYKLAFKYGRKIMVHWMDENSLRKQEELMEKHGVMTIVLGSLSPFPDFLLAYIAGVTRMNFSLFLILDGGCRFIRSLIVVMMIHELSRFEYVKQYSSWISIIIIVYFGLKYFVRRKKT